MVVGEYTYGLPRFRGAVGHGIQPIRYRMLKRMDSFILSRANLWDSFIQNKIPRVSFKLCGTYWKYIWIMTKPQLYILYMTCKNKLIYFFVQWGAKWKRLLIFKSWHRPGRFSIMQNIQQVDNQQVWNYSLAWTIPSNM